MIQKLIGAPGCWGSVIAHNLDTNECSTCEFKDDCGTEANRRFPRFIEILKKRDHLLDKGGKLLKPYNVISRSPKATLKEIRQINMTASKGRFEKLVKAGTPKKVAKVIAQLEKKGVDFLEIKEGVNPLNRISSHKHLHDGFEQLLQNEKVTHAEISNRWVSIYEWREKSARSIASQFFAICAVCDGAVTVQSGVAKLNKLNMTEQAA